MPSSVRRLSRWQLGWMWTSRSSNVGCDHHAVWTGLCVWTTVPSQHILPPRRNALSVSFWRTLTVSTRRVVTARTSAATTTSSPPATGHFSQAAGMQSTRLLHSTGWTQVHSREEYLGLRRLKHESNKKFLGMSSKVPPFALSPDKLAPSSRDGKPGPQPKKNRAAAAPKKCTIFCKDAQKKRTENNRSKVRFCSILL